MVVFGATIVNISLPSAISVNAIALAAGLQPPNGR